MLWEGTWAGKMHRFSGLGFFCVSFFNGFITRSKVKIDWLLSHLFKLRKHYNHYGYSNVKEKTLIQTDVLRFLHSNAAKWGESVGNLYEQFSVQPSEHLSLVGPKPSLRRNEGRWEIKGFFHFVWLWHKFCWVDDCDGSWNFCSFRHNCNLLNLGEYLVIKFSDGFSLHSFVDCGV